MLHDIAFRPLLEQPAGKGAVPFAIDRFQHVQLNKGARFRLHFPGCGRFAGAQAHDGVTHAQRFARFHAEVTGDAVALVEQADNRDPLVHGRAGKGGLLRLDNVAGDAHRAGLIGVGKFACPVATGGQQEAERDQHQ